MQIILRDVVKYYGDKCVLQKIGLEFVSDKRYAVVGASGIGKTTLLRLIAGLEYPDSGEVLMQDNTVVSYAFQEPRLFPGLTVLENVNAVDPERDGQKILKELDLYSETEQYPASLSGGLKKRAGLARALAKQADIYLIDEPTTGQDALRGADIAAAIRTYTKDSVCIVSTHDAELIAAIADVMIVFRENGVEIHNVAGKAVDDIRAVMQ